MRVQRSLTDRRTFLTSGVTVVAAWVLEGRAAAATLGNSCEGAEVATRLAPEGEPGTPLRVRGRVFAPDGERPAAGVTVYAYQTDAAGYYNRGVDRPPRLRGWMKTDAGGRFEYGTIRPGPYPGGGVAAHIHHQLWGAGWPAQYSATLEFEDDRLVGDDAKRRSAAAGRFAWVRPLQPGAGGIAEVTLELRLKAEGDRFEENTRHGLAACGLA